MRNLLMALALLAAPAMAPAADPSEARNGDFGGKLMIVDDVDAFWKAWEGPTPPHINTTSKITLARPVYAMVVFHDCQAGGNGNCNVTARFEIKAPDETQYDEPATAPAWQGPPAPDHQLQASLSSIGFRLEPQDNLGRYQIRVTLTDHVAGKSITMAENVTAEAEASGPVPTS